MALLRITLVIALIVAFKGVGLLIVVLYYIIRGAIRH